MSIIELVAYNFLVFIIWFDILKLGERLKKLIGYTEIYMKPFNCAMCTFFWISTTNYIFFILTFGGFHLMHLIAFYIIGKLIDRLW